MAEQHARSDRESAPAETPRGVGRVSIALVALAILLMVAGVGLGVMFGSWGGGDAPPPPQRAPTTTGADSLADAPAGFLPTPSGPAGAPGQPDAGPDGTVAAEPAEVWSPALFRLGFSFFIGFAIAFALRSFIRLSLIAAGFFAIALLGMQYAGFIEVNWTVLGDRYDSAGAWLSGQFQSFRDFVTGELPSAAGALGGLALGFRSRR